MGKDNSPDDTNSKNSLSRHYFYMLNPPYTCVPVPAGPQQGSKRWPRYLRTAHEEKPPLPLPAPNPAVQPAEIR